MQPQIIVLLGISGSGKGTQAKMLVEKFGLDYVGSGDLLRARIKADDFTGRKMKEVLARGDFAPTSVIFGLWLGRWEALKNKPDFKGFVIDGSPRKLIEAELMDQTLEWYEWNKHLKVLLVDLSRDEAYLRLSQRGRGDDTPDAINSRLDLFEREVMPVIDYYEKQGRLIRVNGEQSVEDVHGDILKAMEQS